MPRLDTLPSNRIGFLAELPRRTRRGDRTVLDSRPPYAPSSRLVSDEVHIRASRPPASPQGTGHVLH